MTIQLSNQNILASVISPALPTAQYTVGSDGNVYKAINNAPAVDIGDWITPQSGMSGYEVRATLNSGSLVAGSSAVGTWINLGASASWWNTDTTGGGPSVANMTVEIRPTGGAVAASATIILTSLKN